MHQERKGIVFFQIPGDYYSSWRAMQDLHRDGQIRAIGVADFYPDRLVDLIDHNEITPERWDTINRSSRPARR